MLTQQHVQKHQLKISPQQIQLLNFFALNSLELENRIMNELEENPFLECSATDPATESADNSDGSQDFQDYDEFMYDDRESEIKEYQNYFGSESIPTKPIVYFADFRENAKQQVNLLEISQHAKDIATYIIDALNDKGLLERSADELSEDISFQQQRMVSADEINEVLEVVRSLEPMGLGSASIHECLLIQLQNMQASSPEIKTARLLVEKYYDALINRQFDKICHHLNITHAQLNSALQEIAKLKFYPVTESGGSSEPRHTILPDFIISRYDDTIVVGLYSSKGESVYVNESLYEQMKTTNKKQKSTRQYIQNKIQSAQWFVQAVKQRENTMLSIMKALTILQHDYFLDGDPLLLKPMILKNVSDITGYDLSTISRITANRYAETHFGLVYLKDLFSEKIQAQYGDAVSNKVIQSIIKDTIEQEDKDKPYTDQQLTDILHAQGYKIARRTISKYREILNIPIAHVRHVQFAIKDYI